MALAKINPSVVLRERKGLCCLMNPPAAFNRDIADGEFNPGISAEDCEFCRAAATGNRQEPV
jgi:hypothetical protein